MNKSGIKTEDYREITLYWLVRLFKNDDPQMLDKFIIQEHVNELATGKLTIRELYSWAGWKPKNKGIEIRTGNPEWGAEPNKLYFVIKHGKIR